MILGLAAAALAAPIRLDRVDLLSEAPATWLSDEAPRLRHTTTVPVIRWVEQVTVAVGLPEGVEVDLSLAAQSLRLERPLPWADLAVGGGVTTRLGLPTGALLGASWRPGPVRLGLSAVLLSDASWARPEWSRWRLLPGVGIGIGPDRRPRAPWM